MSPLVAFALVALVAQGAAAPDVAWELVAEDASGRVSIDPASIVREGDAARATMLSQRRDADANGARSGILLVAFDCAARTATNLRIQTFDGDGRAIATAEIPPERRQTQPVGPRFPLGVAILERVCRPAARGGAPR